LELVRKMSVPLQLLYIPTNVAERKSNVGDGIQA
jgi:hypothetical protein